MNETLYVFMFFFLQVYQMISIQQWIHREPPGAALRGLQKAAATG
jgi:hypothetical protein